MGFLIRDDRQMKALAGLSQAQFDHLQEYPLSPNSYRTCSRNLPLLSASPKKR
jgi:hypothetical protein